MESMSACKSPDVIIVLNDVQANGARIARIRQKISRNGFLDVIAIIFVFNIRVNAVVGQCTLIFVRTSALFSRRHS